MRNPSPLVIYYQLDPFSSDLFSLARNEIEFSFEIVFVSSLKELKQLLISYTPSLIIIEVNSFTSIKFEQNQFDPPSCPVVLLNSEDKQIAEDLLETISPFSIFSRPRNASAIKALIECINIILI